MPKRKRNVKKEDNKTDEVPNPSSKDFDPFAIFNNDLNLIENVSQEDKKKREAMLNKFNSNLNKNEGIQFVTKKHEDLEDKEDIDEIEKNENKAKAVNNLKVKKKGGQKKEPKEIKGVKVNMEKETTVTETQVYVKSMMIRKCQIREFIITGVNDNGVIDNINICEDDEEDEEVNV